MRKFLFLFSILILLYGCKSEEKRSVFNLTDDLGNGVSVALPVSKAVSLAPNLTEIVYFIGAEKALAANTTYCNYPSEAKKKTKIGDLLNVDYEKLAEINPDIVLLTVEGNGKAQYEKLKSLGFSVFVSNPRSFAGILKTISDFGKIFGKEKQAERKIMEIKNELREITSSAKKFEKKSALFLIAVKPLIAAGQKTFINEYLETCGLTNVVAESKLNYPTINEEELLKRNPDYIIIPSKQKKLFAELVENNSALQNLSAIKNNNVIYVNADLYFRPGPRFIDALNDLVNKLKKKEGKQNE